MSYGLPLAMLCDNGPPWGAGLGWREWGPFYTGLAVWIMRLDITLIYRTPNHPQGKGKNERFNGTLQSELLDHEQFDDHHQADTRMSQWRNRYNTVRLQGSGYGANSKPLPAQSTIDSPKTPTG